MPFKSNKQRKFMYANMPEIAKRWSDEAKSHRSLTSKRMKRITGKKFTKSSIEK